MDDFPRVHIYTAKLIWLFKVKALCQDHCIRGHYCGLADMCNNVLYGLKKGKLAGKEAHATIFDNRDILAMYYRLFIKMNEFTLPIITYLSKYVG